MMKRRSFAIFCLMSILTGAACAQMTPSASRNSEKSSPGSRVYFPFRKKASKEQRRRLAPRPDDAARYAGLLAEPRTGIFRLLPDSGCEANTLVVKVDEDCLNRIPDSSFYSFRENEHTQEILSDIRLQSDYLISDGIFTQAMLVNLGDVRLESVTAASEGLKFINEYAPQTMSREVQKQALKIADGIESDGFVYRKTAPVVENATYALRVIAYKGSIYRTFRGFIFDLLAGDKRIDQTLAFRVIRKDQDGGVTIVWRELARRESPRLKYERKKSL